MVSDTTVLPVLDAQLGALTRTQAEILAMIAQGFTNSRIADLRGIDKKTVEMHVKNIYKALQIEVTADQNPRVLAALRFAEATSA